LLDGFADEVLHGSHAAPVGAGDEGISGPESPALYDDRGDGSPSGIETGLDHDPARRSIWVGLELLDLGDQQDHVE
jgi:hypothetical protein